MAINSSTTLSEMDTSNKFQSEIVFEGKTFNLENQYKLVNIDNAEIYEIRTKKNITFKIDKNILTKLFICKTSSNTINILSWELEARSKNKINTMYNGVKTNIVNYITDNTNIDIKYTFKNNDEFDFRISNIEITKIHTKKLAPKTKHIDSPSVFYKENEIHIVEEGDGIKSTAGKYAGNTFNNYRLVEIIQECNPSRKSYYEIFIGNSNNVNSAQYSFIIDTEDFDKVRNVSITNKFNKQEIIHPIWHMSAGQYIWTKINNKTVYLHRFLLNLSDETNDSNNCTIDHINNNKFDNRKFNLRITTQSIQNMNQTTKDHKISLNNIINSLNNQELPKLSIDKLIFIQPEKHIDTKGNVIDIFRIEISNSRTQSIQINDHSTKQNKTGLTVIHRLAHAITKRYIYAVQYPSIIAEMIDNIRFTNLEEFKNHSEKLLTELMKTPTTIDSFLDYMAALKLPKYTDPRVSIKLNAPSANINNSENVLNSGNDITKMKFDFLNYSTARDKYDVSIIIGKDASGTHIKYSKSGCGSDKLSLEDKKAFALVQRYNAFVEIENDLNEKNHSTPDNPALPVQTNYNTTGLKSLTDFKLEGKSMSSFEELRMYTEYLINNLLTSEAPYTMETFASYVSKKANHKKVNLEVEKIK